MTHLSVTWILVIYFAAVNLCGLLAMGIDKLKAIKRGFRIPEATLFLIALIGGSIGSILGMHLFRHKTRHRRFTVGLPVILALQLALAAFLLFGPYQIRTI